MASQETVLITGANGYIGYATTVKALQAGYKVRATVRRQEAADFVKSRGTSIKAFEEKGDLECIILSNVGDKEAFAKAANGCSYIIHIAFPLGNNPGNLHEVAMTSLDALLYAAEQNESVRRIVWTSSVAGITEFEHVHYDHPRTLKLLAGGPEAKDVPVLTAETSVPLPTDVDEESPPYLWYMYGKIAATNALREYAAKSPRFEIVILFPGWTLGPNELCQTRQEAFDGKSTNSFLLFLYQELNYNPIIGRPLEDEPWIPGAFVHLDDVVEAHVSSLKVSMGSERLRSFLLCSDGPSGPRVDDAIQIVNDNFPSEAERMYSNARFSK
ncbi:hypothetical protein PRZ48_008778 [Zasmidium cellare]|uniref:NAD-dependent epimerase/dehydratase domain-containing protein n=1 Tax=Zasmidium cellare TaxID=395010 RepID=A0ABR0EGG8_ZASCE|nr:hypothetical protein PRZ48_008778 [Zasmidium cellare]